MFNSGIANLSILIARVPEAAPCSCVSISGTAQPCQIGADTSAQTAWPEQREPAVDAQSD